MNRRGECPVCGREYQLTAGYPHPWDRRIRKHNKSGSKEICEGWGKYPAEIPVPSASGTGGDDHGTH